MSDEQDGCEWVFRLVLAYLGSPGQRAVKRVCVCTSGSPGIKSASGLHGTMMSVGWSSSPHAYLYTLQTSPAL